MNKMHTNSINDVTEKSELLVCTCTVLCLWKMETIFWKTLTILPKKIESKIKNVFGAFIFRNVIGLFEPVFGKKKCQIIENVISG